MLSEPDLRSYKLDMTSIKSEVFLTGKKRERSKVNFIQEKIKMATSGTPGDVITSFSVVRDHKTSLKSLFNILMQNNL